jgi:DNA-binding response OmpR family regulator
VARILIVEDEAIVAQDLSRTLQSVGLEVVGIADCEVDAARLAAEERPDLVLVDIRLRPDQESDGSRAGIRLAEELWTCHRLPVILVTAFPELVTRDCAANTAVFGVVSKPFSSATLLAQVNIALERASRQSGGVDSPSRSAR